jgi:hypothetical protein
VNAPDSAADFQLPAARLDLEFTSTSGPLCCVDVQFQIDDRHFARTTDDEGRLSISLSPALAYPLVAARGGYSTIRTQIRGLLDGESLAQKFAFEPQTTQATLVVDDHGTADTKRRSSRSSRACRAARRRLHAQRAP